MTDGPGGRAGSAMERPPPSFPGAASGPGPGGSAGPGWYPDPWSGAHHRYWNGEAWTGDSFPHGPNAPAEAAQPAVAAGRPGWYQPPPTVSPEPPPPPHWSPPTSVPRWGEPSPTPATASPPGARTTGLTGAGFIVLVVVVALIVGSLSVVGGYFAFAKRDKSPRVATGPAQVQPTVPTTPADPAASVLSGLVVSQPDVDASVTVQPLAGGTQVEGQTTLDLCNGSYPSESLRTARLQVEALDSQGTRLLSTEAVLYSTPAATAQGFSELKATAAACPDTPVVSPVGEPTVTTRFSATPDGSWPQVPSVERLAFDFVATDATGSSVRTVAVYLRRGRVLMGVYFGQPDAPTQLSVTGQSTIAAITNVFANRMALLPGSVVNG